MSTYSTSELLSLWAKNELTADQARPVGPRHIPQNLLALSQRVAALEKLSGPRPATQPTAEPPAA